MEHRPEMVSRKFELRSCVEIAFLCVCMTFICHDLRRKTSCKTSYNVHVIGMIYIPAGNYMFKVKNSIGVVLVSLLLTLNIFLTLF